MRTRSQIWPEPDPELLRSLSESVSEALQELYPVFARPHPINVRFCHCCITPDRMEAILQTPYRKLACADLDLILMHAFAVWGTWPDLAYFMPRIAECYLSGRIEASKLFYVILEAAHPDYSVFVKPIGRQLFGPPMKAEERQALFHFFGTALQLFAGVHASPGEEPPVYTSDSLLEVVGFLSAFAPGVAPYLIGWRDAFQPHARVQFCRLLVPLFYMRRGSGWVFPTTYAGGFRSLPENTTVLDLLTEPAAVAEYLANNSEHFHRIEEKAERQQIETVFDWASSLAAG